MARFDHPVVETDFRLPHYRRRLTPRLAYHYPLDEIVDSPYFNPAHAPSGAHTGLPATFLQFGSGEIFADDIRALADGMTKDGVKLEVDEISGGLHTEGNIKRALGKKAACWKRMMTAIREMGWSTWDEPQ
jgi:acetyl esterase/lipase